ncbi:glycerol-3-phosphate acyltransferase 2, mitochondrial isoform 1-T1 [Synchiropus picturatus]
MMQERHDGTNMELVVSSKPGSRPIISKNLKFLKKLKISLPSFGKFRPRVDQCCHQCTPDSLRKKLDHNLTLGFRNILSVNESQTRYRGWLVRRVCCVLFVRGCKVHPSPADNRVQRVCQSSRVRKALAVGRNTSEEGDDQGQISHLSFFLPLIDTCIWPGLLRCVCWVMLKTFASAFGTVEINLNHLLALHRASQEGCLLVYVYMRQSIWDWALIPLVLFCHNLRVPYTVCPLQINCPVLRSVLQRLGVILLPKSAACEEEAERNRLYSPVMTSMLQELLHEGQAISIGVSGESGEGGQWVARIRQLIQEGSVADVSLVPVGVSYDCLPAKNSQVEFIALCRWMLSSLWTRPGGNVRINFMRPFSLKEMCESGRCKTHDCVPLQDLLLPVILNDRAVSIRGQRKTAWLLPSSYASELQEIKEREMTIAIIIHLIFSTTSCMAVMSTSLLSCLLLHRHRKGVRASVLCRDMAWLTEEILFRNRDVGFYGSLEDVFYHSLSLLSQHVIIAAVPSRADPAIAPRATPTATLHLTLQAQLVMRAFILESVGACAVSAMLCEVVSSGVSRVRKCGVMAEEVEGDMEFDVLLCQDKLTERAQLLCHLLPPGFVPPCQSSVDFPRDAVHSLVNCGILIMEEVPRDHPLCDFHKRKGTFNWTAVDDMNDSDSDDEEPDKRSYKIRQPSQCPEMLFFLCSLLAGHLRSLCWTTDALENLLTPLPEKECVRQIHHRVCEKATEEEQHYESCSEEAVLTAVRTLIDLGVLQEQQLEEGVFLAVSLDFQQTENRQKLKSFVSQYLYC